MTRKWLKFRDLRFIYRFFGAYFLLAFVFYKYFTPVGVNLNTPDNRWGFCL